MRCQCHALVAAARRAVEPTAPACSRIARPRCVASAGIARGSCGLCTAAAGALCRCRRSPILLQSAQRSVPPSDAHLSSLPCRSRYIFRRSCPAVAVALAALPRRMDWLAQLCSPIPSAARTAAALARSSAEAPPPALACTVTCSASDRYQPSSTRPTGLKEDAGGSIVASALLPCPSRAERIVGAAASRRCRRSPMLLQLASCSVLPLGTHLSLLRLSPALRHPRGISPGCEPRRTEATELSGEGVAYSSQRSWKPHPSSCRCSALRPAA